MGVCVASKVMAPNPGRQVPMLRDPSTRRPTERRMSRRIDLIEPAGARLP